MALKATLTTEEHAALPEAVRPFYTAAQDGKSFVLDADIDNHPAVAGLKNTVGATRKERDDAAKALADLKSAYDGVDAKAAREALDKIRKLEEKNLIDEGKIEELFNTRTERMRKDHDAQVKKLQENVSEREGMIKKLNDRLSEVLIDSGIETAAIKLGARREAMPDVKARGRRVWKLHDDGNPRPYRDDGTTLIFGKDGNKPMTMEEWVTSLVSEAPHLFEPNQGGRTEPSIQRTASGRTISLTREQARDPQQWRSARERAAKEGAEVVVQD